MPTWMSSTATNATSTAYTIPFKIVSFSLANKTGGSITATVGILYGSTFDVLYSKSITTGDSYIYGLSYILLPANNQIYVAASGACDFIFTLEPL